jgi:bifunctional enzyme CysN/CysC
MLEAPGRSDLLYLAAIGSVDDGKSTLIGRLLIDTASIFADQLGAVERASRQRGDAYVDIALITDGLRAERVQGITIDVAYRYFSTSRRKFVLIDCPGHPQYTRNMVTGASKADLVIILMDARQPLTEQARRHATIASLLRVPHAVVCVNKMDLVDWSEEVFEQRRRELEDFASRLSIQDVVFIPVSALKGDNVVSSSSNMPWYHGPTVLYQLEHVHHASDRDLIDVRFPVQYVIRPRADSHHDYRAYAGRVAGGVMKPDDAVLVLPRETETRIATIETFDGAVSEAFPPMSVRLTLADDVDVSRGDMLCRPANRPNVSQELEATLCSLSSRSMRAGDRFILLHTTRRTKATIQDLRYRLDISTLHRDDAASSLELNEIGRVTLRTREPLFYDAYERNRSTGAFVLVDESTYDTVAAGTILAR